jgi:APA family basic amino acid/polyamine antiporter
MSFQKTMGLRRTLSFKDSYLLLFTSIVGSGIFFTTGFVLKSANHPILVLLAWFLGGLFALTGGLSYAYPATIYPHAGGDYVYLKNVYSPMIAFLSGWASLTANFSANITVLALAFSKFLFFLIPALSLEWGVISVGPLQIKLGSSQLIGLILIWFFTILNIRGVKRTFKIQNILSILKITGLLLFILLGFTIGDLHWEHFQLDQTSLQTGYNSIYWNFSFVSQILMAVVPVSFAYLGWNMVTYVAEEIQDPSQNIPKSVILACLSVLTIYSLMNILYLLSSKSSDLINSGEGVGVAAAIHLFGKNAKFYMSAFILVMITGSLPAMIFAGSRIYFAMARDKLFFSKLAEVHPEYHTPHKSLIFQAGYASLLLLFNDIEKLLYFITSAVILMSIFTAMIPIVLHLKKVESNYKIPLFPIPPLFYILGNIFVLVNLTIQSPSNSLIGICMTLAGIPVYLIFQKNIQRTSS